VTRTNQTKYMSIE